MRNNIMKKLNEKKRGTYDIGMGHLGNGITVWDRSREKNGDYITVAHIGDDGKITWYDKKLPSKIKINIGKTAMQHKKEMAKESMVREIIKKELNEVNYSDRLARTLVNSKLVKKGMSEKELFGPIFKQAKKDLGDKKAKYLMGHDHDFLSDTLQAISNLIEAYTHSGDDKLVSLNVRKPIIVVDERHVGKFIIIMMQDPKDSTMRSAIFKRGKESKYNRNKQSDINTLWKLATKYKGKEITELNEATFNEVSIKDWIKDLDKRLKSVFPKSAVIVKFSRNITPAVTIIFTMGKDKSEYPNGIWQNDPAGQSFLIFLDRDIKSDEEDMPEKVTIDATGRGGSILVKPEEGSYMVYSSVKTGWRKKTGSPSKIANYTEDYFKKLKQVWKANIKNLTPEHYKLLGKKY